MITVTLEKEEYDKLLEYKKAYDTHSVVLSSYDWTYGGCVTKIKAISLEDAISLVLTENKMQKEEINKLKSRKWWQKFKY